jgi:hypothetical protein
MERLREMLVYGINQISGRQFYGEEHQSHNDLLMFLNFQLNFAYPPDI